MKFLIVLALVGLGSASFCENEPADSLRSIIKPMFIAQVEEIFGHCKAFKNALRRDFSSKRAGDCSNYFDELYCFGEAKMHEFSSAEDFAMPTYEDMANCISDDGQGRMLAQKSCAYGVPCLDRVVKTMSSCAKRDENFWSTAIDVVERKMSSPLVQGMIQEYVNTREEGDPMGMIVTMIRNRITSYDDLKALIDEHIPEETQEEMIEGARKGLHSFVKKAGEFCRSGCMEVSADYMEGAFSATHDLDTCPYVSPYGFCGNCQDNMEAYIESTDIPCCTQTAIRSVAECVIETIDTYYDLFKQTEGQVIDAIDEIVGEDGIDTYKAVQDNIAIQGNCVKETYYLLDEQVCVEMV